MKNVIFLMFLVLFICTNGLYAQSILVKSEEVISYAEEVTIACGTGESTETITRVYIPDETKVPVNDTTIYSLIENMPEFPEGTKILNRIIERKIKYPKHAIRNKKGGRLFISFIIEKDGSHSHYEIINPLGFGMDIVVIKAVKKMPKWIPGKHKGKIVRTKVTFPVEFILENPNKRK